MSKWKVLARVALNGHVVRVVENVYGGQFRAQLKTKGDNRFFDQGPECETEDHAHWWAMDTIKRWLQDGKSLGRRD